MTNQPKKATTRRKTADLKHKISPAYFLSLEVENVLCFKGRQELNLSDKNCLPAQWTVILGNNGVGKTTILRCLAGMEMIKYSLDEEDDFYMPILGNSQSLWNIWKEMVDIEFSDEAAEIRIDFVSKIPLSSFRQITYPEIQRDYVMVRIGTYSEIVSREDSGLICYGYGATRRMGTTSLSDNHLSFNSASLFSDDENLINAEE